ncbi:MAG: AMP-binding protein [Ruminococcus sp.]|nr:AMP-binding protein [Candidatus Copronaster equi]
MQSVIEYLEKAATLFSDKTALSDGINSLTYRELSVKAKKIAELLLREGYQKSPVMVMAEQNTDTLVYFFGVLYSGNYYIPTDPEMPIEKMQSVYDDSKPFAILGKLSENLQISDCKVFDVSDAENVEITTEFPIKSDGTLPCYMVYTSGSTGKPKGVLKSHEAVCSFAEAYTETFDFTSDEIIGNQTPFFFDASAKDIYLSIKLGATLEIIPRTKFAMPTDLIAYLNEKKITFISWVPTALSIVAQLRTFSCIKPEYLRKVFFVGEVMPVKYLNYWRKNLPDIQYVNLYGQSELAGISCYFEVKGEMADSDTLPMGKPLCNCALFLCDENGNVINEKNKIGEIYVVSPALALEYHNDEKKTAECFFEKDFGDGNGLVRTFKSGDLASVNENGDLVFAARSDFQMKHLGHRIELGEIETVAGALPEIVRCACLYNAEKQAIVLFVQAANPEITPKQIKHILREKLSSYMVPEKIKILEKLPINKNGKIHRQQLKEML